MVDFKGHASPSPLKTTIHIIRTWEIKYGLLFCSNKFTI